MISKKIQTLFDFIDYLDSNKTEYIENYIPVCNDLHTLNKKRNELNPKKNYIAKQQYDEIQNQITEKLQPISRNVCIPILNKLTELGIWSGDDLFTSIWNNNISAIHDFTENFTSADIPNVKAFKSKYLSFRTETNSNFFYLQFLFDSLDQILKVLFDFFKDTNENEFENFETKSIYVNSIQELVEHSFENPGSNLKFSLPQTSLFDYYHIPQIQPHLNNIKNEVIMGDKIHIDIKHNSGQIIAGKSITISDSLNNKKETAGKITELIALLRKDHTINDELRQSLITNFDKVKDELFEDQPSKTKISKWLSNTKEVLEKLVLSHEVVQAVDWVFKNLNFL